MSTDKQQRVLELAGQLCDETLSQEGFQELDLLLRDDPEARECYQAFVAMHRRLESPEQEAEIPQSQAHQPATFTSNIWLAIAALLMLSFIGIVLKSIWDEPANKQQIAANQPFSPTVTEPPVAILTRAIDIEWGHKSRFQAELGEAVEPGWIRIASGIAEVTFSSGATVTVEGPAHLRVDTPLQCISKFGKLSANCPPSAHGFTVRFPGGKVVDLGTEFVLDSEPQGATKVHVLDGEVVVALTDEDEQVLKEQHVFGAEAVKLEPEQGSIEAIDYDASPYEELQQSHLIATQPIALQFDLGHRAGLYTGTNSPAHAAGDLHSHQNLWNQIVGDHSGDFVMADGNMSPYSLVVDYGHGEGKINWDVSSVEPRGKIWPKAAPIFNTELGQDHRPAAGQLGFRVKGLPKGNYRVHALCRSTRRPKAEYDVAFGINLDRLPAEPTVIVPLEDPKPAKWLPGQTHAVGEVAVDSPDDWLTFITRYSPERSPKEGHWQGLSVLLGVQIIEIRK